MDKSQAGKTKHRQEILKYMYILDNSRTIDKILIFIIFFCYFFSLVLCSQSPYPPVSPRKKNDHRGGG